jgi:hypothetical protein
VLEVGNSLTVWRDDETDHILDRPPRTGDNAIPLGAARSRSMIEFGELRLRQHC